MMLVLLLALAQDAATLTFTERVAGSFPGALQGRETVVADLSKLPKGVTIHRAVFRPGRDDAEAFAARDRGVKVTVTGGDQPLRLLLPRSTAFDVTFAVKHAG